MRVQLLSLRAACATRLNAHNSLVPRATSRPSGLFSRKFVCRTANTSRSTRSLSVREFRGSARSSIRQDPYPLFDGTVEIRFSALRLSTRLSNSHQGIRGSAPNFQACCLSPASTSPSTLGKNLEKSEPEDLRARSIVQEEEGTLQQSRAVSILELERRITMVAVKDSIELTPIESRIFETLMDTVRHFELKTQLRVAGGWVRDKLLGRDCFDIDIALDDMLGRHFSEKVNALLKSRGEEVRGVGVIQSNPEQSKHLETATMMIHGTWIDFVNLRSETYSEESRIPDMEFGSAEQDALRRDLTINSLFYNVNLGVVEDLTGRGIADLKAGVVRTPLPALKTFLDDPLRVLRAVRFGNRFGFSYDSELLEAAAREDVRNALSSKISRERIGKETELMLQGHRPLASMQLLSRLLLFPSVFALPVGVDPAPGPEYASQCISSLEKALLVEEDRTMFVSMSAKKTPWIPSSGQRLLFLFASLLLPLRGASYPDKKGKRIPVTQHILRESLKQKSAVADGVLAIHGAIDEFQPLLQSLSLENGGPPRELSPESRIAAGRLVRKVKDNWRIALLLCASLIPKAETASRSHLSEKRKRISSSDAISAEDQAMANSVSCTTEPHVGFEDVKAVEDVGGRERGTAVGVAREDGLDAKSRRETKEGENDETNEAGMGHSWARLCWSMEQLIEEAGLCQAWELKPLLDGRSLMKLLDLRGGPLIGEWMEKVVDWQLAHPIGTVDELRDWLVKEKGLLASQ